MKNQKPSQVNRMLLLAGMLALSACGSGRGGGGMDQQTGSAQTSIPVEVAIASRKAITARYSGTAALEPENQAQVVAKATGVMLALLVEEGSAVKAGQLLARLDPEKPQLELARAEANLKRLENEFKRSSDLVARKLVSTEAHDRARFDLDTQRASYDIAKLDLEYTRIVAPISGVISERMVKVGNLIQLQQVLFRIDDFDPLLAVLSVPERELATIRAGLPVEMNVDALPGQVFKGTVARISPVIDAGTGTFRVTTEFRDAEQRLKSGMFGRVSIVHDQRDQALVVPRDSLLEGDSESAVYLLDRTPPASTKDRKDGSKTEADENKKRGFFAGLFGSKADESEDAKVDETPPWYVRRVAVRLGYLSGADAEIIEGLVEGDQVVTIGKNALREGARVQIVNGANSP